MRAEGIHCFTSATFSYLDRARILAETLRRHHPNWTLWLCLPDEKPPGCDIALEVEQFDHILRLSDLAVPQLAGWVFSHDLVELSTAVKGPALLYLLETAKAERVIYLDPDIAVFDSLDQLIDLLDDHAVLLTPHLLDPEDELGGIEDNEIPCLKHGIYNLGFLGVNASAEGLRFAAWWRERLI